MKLFTCNQAAAKPLCQDRIDPARHRLELGAEKGKGPAFLQETEEKRLRLCATVFHIRLNSVQECAAAGAELADNSSIFMAFSVFRPAEADPWRLECDLRLSQAVRSRRMDSIPAPRIKGFERFGPSVASALPPAWQQDGNAIPGAADLTPKKENRVHHAPDRWAKGSDKNPVAGHL